MSVVTLRMDVDGTPHLIPCYEDTSIQITRSVSEIESLSSQKTLSQTFRVPESPELIEAIGKLSDLGQDPKVNINRKIEGGIILNNFDSFNGSFQIGTTVKNPNSGTAEVNLFFKGQETNLKSILSEVKMKDLFDGEFIDYSIVEINSFLTNPEGYINASGYSFPLIDYGQNYVSQDESGKFNIQEEPLTQLNFKPAVSFKKCFELMPVDIGTDSSIDDLMAEHIPLHNNTLKTPVLDTSPLDYAGDMSKTVPFVLNGVSIGVNYSQQIPFEDKYVYNNNQFDLVNNRFLVPFDGSYVLGVKGDVTLSNLSGTGTRIFSSIRVYDYASGATLLSKGLMFLNIFVNSGSSNKFTLDNFDSFDLKEGQDIGIEVTLFTDISAPVSVTINEGFKFVVSESPAVSPTSRLDIAANCPDITAWDIFRTVALKCKGVILWNSDGTYNLIPWIDWIDSNNDTLILDNSVSDSSIVIEPFSIKGAKKILLTYAKDTDILNKAYEDQVGGVYGELLIEDTGTDFTQKEFKVELPFAATPLGRIEGTNLIIPKFVDSSLETLKTKPRSLAYNGQSMNYPIETKDLFSSTTYSFTQVPFFGHWSKIEGGYNEKDYNFGSSFNFFSSGNYPNNTLFERFWAKYIEETYSNLSRRKSLSVELPTLGHTDFQFNEKVYYNNNQYRITKLKNIELSSVEVVPIEMMKRVNIEKIDIAPYYPYNIINNIVSWKKSSDNSDVVTPNASDLEESCKAYGFFYDSNLNQGTEITRLLKL